MQSKHLFVKVLKLFVFFILVALIYPLGKWFFPYTPDTVPLEGDLNYGLDEEIDELILTNYQDDIKGHLYFSLVETDDANEPININVHAYDLMSGIARPIISFGTNHGLLPISNHSAILMSVIDDDNGVSHEVPIWLDTDTLEYSVLGTVEGYTPYGTVSSPASGRDWVAISFNKEDASGSVSLQNWQIMLSNPVTDETILLEDAISPQWLNEGDDVVYIKEDGVYRYNFVSAASERIFDFYQNLDSRTEISVSPQNDYMVLTLPGLDAISVLQFLDAPNGLAQEIGRIQTQGRQYITPVFSPDGRFYAVVGRDKEILNNSAMEIRSVYSREPLEVIPLKDYLSGELYLSAWSNFKVQPVVVDDNS